MVRFYLPRLTQKQLSRVLPLAILTLVQLGSCIPLRTRPNSRVKLRCHYLKRLPVLVKYRIRHGRQFYLWHPNRHHISLR
jgi:hypothetical protein